MEPKQGLPDVDEGALVEDESTAESPDSVNERLIEKAMPLVEAFYTGAEAQIRRHLEPLIVRIADLEDEVARLRDVVDANVNTVEADTAAEVEEYDSGEA